MSAVDFYYKLCDLEQNLESQWWYLCCTVKKDDEFDWCSKACGGFKFLTFTEHYLLMMAYQNNVCLWTFFLHQIFNSRCSKNKAKKKNGKEM